MFATGRGSARMKSSSRARDGALFEAWLEARLANVDPPLQSPGAGTIGEVADVPNGPSLDSTPHCTYLLTYLRS
jgi:hypothetical protein